MYKLGQMIHNNQGSYVAVQSMRQGMEVFFILHITEGKEGADIVTVRFSKVAILTELYYLTLPTKEAI